MEKLFVFCVVLIYRLNDAAEDVSSSKVIQESPKDAYDAHLGTKNASYFINPKKFLTYVEQFDKIKSLGAEVRCKLHGSCNEERKRHKISKKSKRTKASKKSMQSMPNNDVPDNHNNVLSPESLMSPVAAGLLPPGMGSEYTQQPGAASFGQQPQMNVKLPRGMEVQMGSQGSQTLDQMQNAENEASIQNSIRAKMDFMDRANGPQMAVPGMHGVHDLGGSPGGSPEGMPGDMMTPGGPRAAFNGQHKPSREVTVISEKRSPSNTHANVTKGNSSTHANETVTSLSTQSNATSNTTPNTTSATSRTFTNETLKNSTETSSNVSLSNDAKNVSTLDAKNVSAPLSDVKNESTLTTKNGSASLNSTSQTDGPAPENKTSNMKDTKATKKSFNLRRRMDLSYKPNDLPPIYLTVKNGEKVLVVHPTIEFLQSLPRINFTDPADEKRPVAGRVRSSEIYTGKYAKIRDDLLLKDDDKDNDDDDDAEDENDDEGSTDSNINTRSNVAYVSIPIIPADPGSQLNNWLRYARDQIIRRDSTKNFDAIRNTQNQLSNMGNIYTTEEYLKGERKSDTALPVPRDIQNLYKKFHPEDSRSNFQYIPSRDEVAEELQYAQQGASLNNREADEGNVEQNAQNTQGDIQGSPEGDYDTGGDVPDTAAASPTSETQWEEKYKNLDSDGRKRSENPVAMTK